MGKSFVTVETGKCVICGKVEETNSLLFDRRLRETFERNTLTGFLENHCKNCQIQLADGERIALVAIDEEKSKEAAIWKEGAITGFKPELVFRTGSLAFLTRSLWEQIFNIPPPETDMVFIQQEVFDKLAGHPDRTEVAHGEVCAGAESAEHNPEDAQPEELPPPDPGRDASTEDDERPEGGDSPV